MARLPYIIRPALHQTSRIPAGNSGLLILLHGLGSDENDLMGLAPYLDPTLTIACFRAPKEYGPGFSWFDIHWPGGVPVIDERDALVSRDRLVEEIRTLAADYDRTILGGFSQGAMMSLGVAMTGQVPLVGLVLLSGALVPGFATGVGTLPRTFQSHGLMDDILPIESGRELSDFVRPRADAQIREYRMGHEISAEVLRDLRLWIDEGDIDP